LSNQTLATLFPGLPEFIRDLNIGTAAALLNVVTLAIVSAATASRRQEVAAE
jgi:SSS family solute:Na+ symporter